jgi:enoyl-CoA hydratase/carnithine racemase
MLAEVSSGLARAAEDDATRVVLLSGAGCDFCAGADLGELEAAAGTDGAVDYGERFEEVLRAIEEHPLPVVGVIRGAALGAGCQLAVACDLAVAAADATLGIPSGRLGIVIGHENIERLVASVGPKRAAELLLAGRTVSGEEAAAWGLVNEAVPPDALEERAAQIADRIARSAPISVRGSKAGIRSALGGDRARFEELAGAAFGSEDLREGVRAFRERRPPRFRGA